jgi:membrane-associated phospholipid phosphatase
VIGELTLTRRRWALVAFLGALCFAFITWRVTTVGTLTGDGFALRVARHLHSHTLDRVLHDYSDVTEWIVVGALLWTLWIVATTRGRRRRRALVLILVVVAALVVKEVTTELVVRPGAQLYGGPYQIYGGTDEYPSGHATATLALCAELLILLWTRPYRRWLVLAALVFVGSVGLSRALVESHFASDVLAGWAVAIAVVGAVAALVDISDGPPELPPADP